MFRIAFQKCERGQNLIHGKSRLFQKMLDLDSNILIGIIIPNQGGIQTEGNYVNNLKLARKKK